ncbi:MAG: hypothetical protein SPJ13_06610, partial [Bacteroidales bacterium]|nr:hypothetical protein [Bacteroidales bacterium]
MKTYSFILTACIMLGGAPLLISCAKEDTAAYSNNESSEMVCMQKKEIKVDFYFTDSSGKPWHIYGTIDLGATSAHVDLSFESDGQIINFRGKIKYRDIHDGKLIGIEGTATDENGKPVELDNLEELLVAVLNEATNNEGIAPQKTATATPVYQIENVEGTVTDEQGNPIAISNLNELLE